MAQKQIGEMRSRDFLIDPTTPTILSNDFIISAASFSVKDGNFIQTNSNNGVFNYSSRNTFLQAEEVDGYGPAYTGSSGFCILSVNPDSQILKLSGDLSSLESFYKSNPKQKYSILLESSAAEPYCTTITKIEGQYVTLKDFPKTLNGYANCSEEQLIEWFLSDDNAFYAPEHPEVGNQNLPCLYGGHAEGGSTKSIGKFTHAEGRACVSDMRYSHSEGDQNKALGIGSKAEGKLNVAYGKYSHVDGYEATAKHDYSYVWRARGGTSGYTSNGEGTFNICPEGGTNGFYIGNQSLAQLLEKPLKGEDYPLSTVENIMIALSAVIVALGGTVQIPPEVETKNN